MEARVKAMRKKILFSKLETFKNCNERKRKIDKIYLKKKNVFDFSEKEEDCEDKFSTQIEARYSISYLKKKFFIGLGSLLNKHLRV